MCSNPFILLSAHFDLVVNKRRKLWTPCYIYCNALFYTGRHGSPRFECADKHEKMRGNMSQTKCLHTIQESLRFDKVCKWLKSHAVAFIVTRCQLNLDNQMVWKDLLSSGVSTDLAKHFFRVLSHYVSWMLCWYLFLPWLHYTTLSTVW